jgi:hypothetical protein
MISSGDEDDTDLSDSALISSDFDTFGTSRFDGKLDLDRPLLGYVYPLFGVHYTIFTPLLSRKGSHSPKGNISLRDRFQLSRTVPIPGNGNGFVCMCSYSIFLHCL